MLKIFFGLAAHEMSVARVEAIERLIVGERELPLLIDLSDVMCSRGRMAAAASYCRIAHDLKLAAQAKSRRARGGGRQGGRAVARALPAAARRAQRGRRVAGDLRGVKRAGRRGRASSGYPTRSGSSVDCISAPMRTCSSALGQLDFSHDPLVDIEFDHYELFDQLGAGGVHVDKARRIEYAHFVKGQLWGVNGGY